VSRYWPQFGSVGTVRRRGEGERFSVTVAPTPTTPEFSPADIALASTHPELFTSARGVALDPMPAEVQP
jgi:hypothetical protein